MGKKEQEEERDEPLPVANIASRQCGAVLGGYWRWEVQHRPHSEGQLFHRHAADHKSHMECLVTSLSQSKVA